MSCIEIEYDPYKNIYNRMNNKNNFILNEAIKIAVNLLRPPILRQES